MHCVKIIYIVIERIFIYISKIKVREYNYNSQSVTPHIRTKKLIWEQKWKHRGNPNRFVDQGRRPCSGSSSFSQYGFALCDAKVFRLLL